MFMQGDTVLPSRFVCREMIWGDIGNNGCFDAGISIEHPCAPSTVLERWLRSTHTILGSWSAGGSSAIHFYFSQISLRCTVRRSSVRLYHVINRSVKIRAVV